MNVYASAIHIIFSTRSLCFLAWLSVLSVFTLFSPVTKAADVPQSFTLDGRLFNSTAATAALIDSNVTVRIQILDEDKVCVLYEEQQVISTLASNGYFSIQVGSSTGDGKRTGSDSALPMSSVFQNINNISGKAASNGAPCTLTATAAKRRYVRVFVAPSTMGGAERLLSPDLGVDSVPNAVVAERAESLQGLRASNMLQVNTSATNVLSQPNLENLFSSTARFNALTALVDGTSVNYMRSNSASGAQLPVLAGAPAAPAQGSVWYDSTDQKVKFQASGGPVTLSTGGGTVSSVGFTAPAELSVTGAPVTTSGTIAVTWSAQTTNKVLAAPDGSTGTPSFRVLVANDIPALPWSKITSGTPTTIAGYGITDAVTNAGSAPSIQSGLDAGKPAAATAGRVYFAYDTQKIYRDSGVTWTLMSTGAPAFSDLSGTATLAQLPVVDFTKGGTGLTAGGTANQILGMNAVGTASEYKTVTAGSGVSVTHGAGTVTIATTGAVPTGTAGGDLSGTYPNPTVSKIQGVAVNAAAPATGQVLRYGGAEWAAANFSIGNLLTAAGAQQFAGSATCAASQTLTWSSLTDTFTCTNIAGLDAGTITTGTIADARLPATATAWTINGSDIYRAAGNVGIGVTTPTSKLEVDGVIKSSSSQIDLGDDWQLRRASMSGNFLFDSAGASRFVVSRTGSSEFAGGLHIDTSNSGAGTTASALTFGDVGGTGEGIGSNRAGAGFNQLGLDLFTAGSRRLSITSSGNVGIGTLAPARLLHVNGPMRLTASTLPLAPDVGDVAVDSGDSNKLKYFDGSTWQAAGGAASSVLASNGTAGAPSISFLADSDTGLYRSAPDTIGVTAGGNNIFSVNYATGLAAVAAGGGVVGAVNGGAGAPTFSFTGDSGTGWWRPAANTIAVSTGAAERMRIDSSGRVGIGTSTPSFSLSFNAAGTTTIAKERSNSLFGANGEPLNLVAGGAATGGWVNLSGGNLTLSSGTSTGTGSSSIAFQTATPGASGATDRVPTTKMTILGSGNVGIGTVSPQFALDVEGGTHSTFAKIGNNFPVYIFDPAPTDYSGVGFNLYRQISDGTWRYGKGSSANYGGFIGLIPATGNIEIGTSTAGNVDAVAGVTTRMTISQSGKVGIGVSGTPSYPLHINSINAADSPSEIVNITNNDSTNGESHGLRITAGNGSSDFPLKVTSRTSVEYFSVSGDGNVGIGTSTPGASSILDISSTTKGVVLPRMTKVQRNAIASPVAGMAIYQTDNTPGLRVYNGTNWMRFTETAD